MSRIYLGFLICCLFALAVPRFFGGQPGTPTDPQDRLHIYLLIGGPNMAGRAAIPGQADALIDRCLLLNADNGWEPASHPFNRHSTIADAADRENHGPADAFARTMLARDASTTVGLVVNAGGTAEIDQWTGRGPFYWGARGRSRAAIKDVGTLKGVLWLHGEDTAKKPAAYADQLRTLIGNLRADLGDLNLPFLIGQVPGNPELNAALANLAETNHFTEFVTSSALTVLGGKHYDARGQDLLGKAFADRMIALQAEHAALTPAAPADIAFIDPHVHAMSVTPIGLRAVARWMDERNVERCIVSPLNHKGSRPQSEEERQIMLENFRPYAGRIDRMTILDPGVAASVEEAVAILGREMADGAIAFGEHYGKGLMFDDPKNLLLYEACEKVGLPVMFHIDQRQNMVEPGMARVDRVLGKFPDCTVVAHAYWWLQLADGTCDRQLQQHPNLYADMSGTVVVNVLNRDRAYAREFIIRNQDKLLWATDEGWWSYGDPAQQMNLHYTFFEELDLPKLVRQKIYRENAIKVYGLK